MAITPEIALIVVLITIIFLYTIKEFLGDLAILSYFLWAFSNIEGSFKTATFYALMLIFVMLVRGVKGYFGQTGLAISKSRWVGYRSKTLLLGVITGVGIWLGMRFVQGTVSASIIGVPSLAISSTSLSVTTVMLLGIVENRAFFTVLDLLKENVSLFYSIPVFGNVCQIFSIILPQIVIGLAFGFYHIAVYSLSLSSIVWASSVMIIWVLTRMLLKSDLAPNIAHALWNGTIALSRALGIAI